MPEDTVHLIALLDTEAAREFGAEVDMRLTDLELGIEDIKKKLLSLGL